MNETLAYGNQHLRAAASAEKAKASLEANGEVFELVEVRSAKLPGLTVNRDSPLEIWITPVLISALEAQTARLEIVLADVDIAPTIIASEFRGSVRVGFRSSDAAFVLEKSRNFNMRALFYARSYFSIGADTSCNSASVTLSDATISIARDCMLSHDITIQPSDQHDIVDIAKGEIINTKRTIILEDHVWIGKEAYLGAGCHVGTGAVVGARSVVTGPVAANTIVGGNPARVIREGVAWKREFNSVDASGKVLLP